MQPSYAEESPWVPESLKARLVVGAKVRIHLRGECPGLITRWNFPSGLVEVWSNPYPHWVADLDLNGTAGVIEQIYDGTENLSFAPGHPYQVLLLESAPNQHGFQMASFFTAAELEPLGTPADVDRTQHRGVV